MTEIDVTGLEVSVLTASALPAVREALPSPTGTPDRVVLALVSALARCRGLPEDAVALAHPLHAPDVADRLVVDLARCRGTGEQVVRLSFGLPA